MLYRCCMEVQFILCLFSSRHGSFTLFTSLNHSSLCWIGIMTQFPDSISSYIQYLYFILPPLDIFKPTFITLYNIYLYSCIIHYIFFFSVGLFFFACFLLTSSSHHQSPLIKAVVRRVCCDVTPLPPPQTWPFFQTEILTFLMGKSL